MIGYPDDAEKLKGTGDVAELVLLGSVWVTAIPDDGTTVRLKLAEE